MAVTEPHGAANDVPERTDALPHEGKAATGDDSHQTRVLTAESPITYLYLTFDTPLPSANSTLASIATPAAPPDEPNLIRYLNPTQWPTYRKAYHMVLCCIATGLTAYCAGSFSPPISIMEAEFDASKTALLTGLTTFCMGFALAPMVLAPFSEINGRYPVFAVSGVIFVVFQIVCGFVPDLAGMLVARFIVGVGGSVFSTMIGGVIADLWDKEGRNTPMAIFSGSVLAGTGLGPMVTSIITYRYGDDGDKWKWVFWHQVIMGGVLMTLIVVFFRESRGSVVLSRKAKALNKWYDAREKAGYYGLWLQESASGVGEGTSGDDSEGVAEKTGSEDEDKKVMTDLARPRSGAVTTVRLVRLRWRVKSDDERASLGKMISISLYRPFFLLCTEPVVFFFSLWVSFAWAVLYLTFASIPYIFETVYGWNVEDSGYIFASMIVGAFLSTIIGVLQDELLKHPQWRAENWSEDSSYNEHRSSQQQRGPRAKFYAILRRHFPVEAPESRLYFTCITATLLPIGLFLFGFTSHPSTPWISPAIAICLATMGIYSVYLATFNYLADVYHMYASSALAAQSCCRNVLGGIFPLVTLPLFENLGNSGAGGVLGGIALALTFVPWVLVFYGSRIRARSKFALILENAG
ncbi:hypothetical protein SLS53_006092 [Cytospora paraplurivora]|uniref:Major facilitator superfamily (MFS) profile domain-containing protein n=1 Tax=Cytospora paraplurivora TaxID=2898453 RepID=A0AAN9UC94_9PEZI